MSSSLSRGTRGCLLAVLLSLSASCAAQEDDAAPQTAANTLHAYTHLIQMPTLVLGADRKPLPPLSREQFTLRFDSGPPFHPTQIHLEGDDPITLAILIDVTDPPSDSFANLDATFAALPLTPRDHVVIFAVDCTIIRTPDTFPANPQALRDGVATSLSAASLHGPAKHQGDCHNQLHLWDTIGLAARELSTQPGRRVILALTRSTDHNSVNSWHDVEKYANTHSITIFVAQNIDTRRITSGFDLSAISANPLSTLCAATGGLPLLTSPEHLSATLNHFVELVRGRYIIEFQRPSNATPGSHQLDIKVPARDAIVLASGTRALLADDAIAKDPNTIQSDSTQAPTQGTGKGNKKPH